MRAQRNLTGKHDQASFLAGVATSALVVFTLSGRVQADGPVAPSPTEFHIDAQKTLGFLAADEQEGRGVGTEGLDRAADLIADDFLRLGLKPLPGQSNYFQPFKMTSAIKIGPKTELSEGDAPLKVNSDFVPLSFSGEKEFDAGVVFAGYGVSSTAYGYDDYADLDVKGKIVLVLRFEPHNEKGTSRFGKDEWTDQAHLSTKVAAAMKHGAAAIVFVNPPSFHPGERPLMPFGGAMGERAGIPVLQVSPNVAEEWLKKAGQKPLKDLQAAIDGDGRPHSLELTGVKLKGQISLLREQKPVKNVMAMLPGIGPDADQYLVIGAHYDHLGYGGPGSLAPGVRAIHHGADDNASGTTAVLKLADYYAHLGPQKKSLIFITFTGEEEGLIGSAYWVNHPPVPLDRIVAMLNLDMVGRVRNHLLYVGGAGTAPSFDAFLKEAAVDSPLKFKSFGRGGMGPSDHMSFALKKIPVLFLFSGLHMDYHRPSDTADKINFAGIDEVVSYSIKLLDGLQEMPKEKYVDASDKDSMSMSPPGGHTGARVTLGIVPDYSTMDDATPGVKISGTSSGSPADRAGLKSGDTILQWNQDKVESLQQLTNFLGAAKPGDKVKLLVQRDGKRIELEATLAEKK